MESTRAEPPLAVKIVEAVATAREEDGKSLEPLATYLDPGALERFVDSASVSTEIRLELYDCMVEIDTDRNVTVRRNGT